MHNAGFNFGPLLPSIPGNRGYHAVYHDGEINHCPGCGRTHWLIGRQSAECAFCTTALPLEGCADAGAGAANRLLAFAPAQLCRAERSLTTSSIRDFLTRAVGIYRRG